MAPNGNESRLYSDALALVGDSERAASIYGMAYSPGFLEYTGDWTANPAEFDLDANGEIGLDHVLAYMRRNDFAVGDFLADEVKDLENAMPGMGVGDIGELAEVIGERLVSAGDVTLTRESLVRSGLYTADEAARVMSSPGILRGVTSMMRRIMAYVAANRPMSRKDYRFLSAIPANPDLTVYEEGYDALGKRRTRNWMEVDQDISRVVAGIKDRQAFDAAFMDVPYDDITERYSNDRAFADRMYERYSGMTRMPVVDPSGTPMTDSMVDSTVPYLRVTPSLDSLRKKVGEIIDMEDDAIGDSEDLYRRVMDMADDAADLGIDISPLISVDELTVEGEAFRDLMVSFDLMLSSMRRGQGAVDLSFLSEMDAIAGLGNQQVETTYPGVGDDVVFSRTGSISPVEMFSRGFLYVGRNRYVRVNDEGTVDELYEAMAEAAKADNTSLPGPIVGDVTPSTDNAAIIDRIKRYVMGHVSSSNTERMVLTRLALGLSPDPAVEGVSVRDELSRYVESLDRREDMASGVMELRRAQIRERIKNSDLYNNVLRFLRFGPDYTISLTHSDPETRRRIEMSLPDGKVRRTLRNYAMMADESTMRDLFFLEDSDRDDTNVGFRRWLYANHPDLLREPAGPATEVDGDTIRVMGSYDDFIARDSSLYEKVGESVDGSYYRMVTPLRYSDAAAFSDNLIPRITEQPTHSDTATISDVNPSPSYEMLDNRYTSGNGRLMEELTCRT